MANPSTLAETTVDAGFSASDFTVSAPFSSGNINLLGLATDSLHIQTSGCAALSALCMCMTVICPRGLFSCHIFSDW